MAVRREVKESNSTREKFMRALGHEECLMIEEVTKHKFAGRCSEGLVFEDTETGLFTVIKVITKAPDFDGTEEIADFTEKEKIKATKESKKNGPVVTVKKGKAQAFLFFYFELSEYFESLPQLQSVSYLNITTL